MKAVVFQSPKKMQLKDVAVPDPGPQEVLVEVKSAGLCGTDVHIYDGDFMATYPLIPGHEFAGEIVATGSEVKDIPTGSRVAVDPNVPCRACVFCRRNREHFCRHLTAYGVHLSGGFAEFAAVKAENVHAIDDLSFEEGAMIEPLSCVLHGMEMLQLQPGDEVLVFGVGPIGLLLAQVAKLSGAASVAAVDLSEEKLEFAKSLGIDNVFIAKNEVQQKIHQRYPDGFDIAIDATGVPGVVENLPKYVKDGGKLLYFGVCPKDAEIKLNPYDVYRRELKIFGTFSLLANFVPAIRLVQSGRIDVKSIISHRFSLKEFPEAMSLMMGPKHKKIIISRI